MNLTLSGAVTVWHCTVREIHIRITLYYARYLSEQVHDNVTWRK